MGEWSRGGGGGVIHDQGKFAFGRDEPARLSVGTLLPARTVRTCVPQKGQG